MVGEYREKMVDRLLYLKIPSRILRVPASSVAGRAFSAHPTIAKSGAYKGKQSPTLDSGLSVLISFGFLAVQRLCGTLLVCCDW